MGLFKSLFGGVSNEESKFLELAEQGNTDAQHNLGVMYFTGTYGFIRDNYKAIYWLTKAARQGSVEAQDILKKIYKN